MANQTQLIPIIDSQMSQTEALTQNPLSPAPAEILAMQVLIEVRYISFDGLLHQGQIVIHQNLAIDVEAFFEQALLLEFPVYSVIPVADSRFNFDDEISCNKNNTSGYNYREITGGGKISNHAQGLAFDVNTVQNVYARYDATGRETYRLPATAPYDVNAPGTVYKEHPLVHLMEARGWTWGGNWGPIDGPVDYQHFEKPDI
jgi:hypothetical protein